MILPGNMATEETVRNAFRDAISAARKRDIPLKEERDADFYTAQFMRTKDTKNPIIPTFMRAYCAAKIGCRVTDYDEWLKRRRTEFAERAARRQPVYGDSGTPFQTATG